MHRTLMGSCCKEVIQAERKFFKISKSNPPARMVWSHNPGSASQCAVLSFLLNFTIYNTLIIKYTNSIYKRIVNTQINFTKNRYMKPGHLLSLLWVRFPFLYHICVLFCIDYWVVYPFIAVTRAENVRLH